MMMRIVEYSVDGASALSVLKRPYEASAKEMASVAEILADVEERGDEALSYYSEKFDKTLLKPENMSVTQKETDNAYAQISDGFVDAVRAAKGRIYEFHKRQLKQSWFITEDDGTILGHRYIPMERVGIYVPGGTAPLASTLLMNTVPALVAGVSEIAMVVPPMPGGKVNPYILVAAAECGLTEIYRVGGPWSIGALAYGTGTIRKVDKIVGPGNIYVSLAKKLVYGRVGIDGLYGPSEIVVVADDTADPEYVAADLLSQAEHGVTSGSILITPSRRLAESVSSAVEAQLSRLSRADIAAQALKDWGAVIITKDLDEAIVLANECAPEHLEVITPDPWSLLHKVKHAGAVFLGQYSTEPIGDYIAGTNHCLPTNGTARFSSGLGVDDFMKRHSVVAYSKAGIDAVGPKAVTLAEVEGLTAHANSIKIRLERGR